jgi:hypothetical protein
MAVSPSNVPIPDPTVLTTAQLIREMGTLKELFETKLGALKEQLLDAKSAQKDALELAFQTTKDATTLQNTYIRETIAKSEGATAQEIQSLKALVAANKASSDEKLDSVNSRLDRGDGKSSGVTAMTATLLAVAAIVVSLGVAFVNNRQPPVAPTVISPAVIPVQPK